MSNTMNKMKVQYLLKDVINMKKLKNKKIMVSTINMIDSEDPLPLRLINVSDHITISQLLNLSQILMQVGGDLCAKLCLGCCLCLCQQMNKQSQRTRYVQKKAPIYSPLASGSVINTKGCILVMFLLILLCLALFAVVFDFVQDNYYANMKQNSYFPCQQCESYTVDFNGQCCNSQNTNECQDIDYCIDWVIKRNEGFMIAGFVYIGLFAIGGIVILVRYKLKKRKAALQQKQVIMLIKEESPRRGSHESRICTSPKVKEDELRDASPVCMLCCEPIENNSSRLMICCETQLHRSCSSLWIEHKKACPSCRKSLTD